MTLYHTRREEEREEKRRREKTRREAQRGEEEEVKRKEGKEGEKDQCNTGGNEREEGRGQGAGKERYRAIRNKSPCPEQKRPLHNQQSRAIGEGRQGGRHRGKR